MGKVEGDTTIKRVELVREGGISLKKKAKVQKRRKNVINCK